MKILIALLLAVALPGFTLLSAPVTLTTPQGQSVEAEVLSVVGRNAQILHNNRKIAIKLNTLTEESQLAAISAAKSAGAYQSLPPLKIQARVGSRQKRSKGVSWNNDMTLSPAFTMEGASQMDPVGKAEATMIVITMETRAKYVQRVEKYRIESKETIKVPPAENGRIREFKFEELTTTFDAWRDKTNLGGWAYKYFVFILRDPETQKVVELQSNNPQIENTYRTSEAALQKLLGLSKGSPINL